MIGNLDCEGDQCSSAGPFVGAALGGSVGALAGGAVGGLLGLAARTERWQSVESRRVSLRVEPERDGIAAALTIRF